MNDYEDFEETKIYESRERTRRKKQVRGFAVLVASIVLMASRERVLKNLYPNEIPAYVVLLTLVIVFSMLTYSTTVLLSQYLKGDQRRANAVVDVQGELKLYKSLQEIKLRLETLESQLHGNSSENKIQGKEIDVALEQLKKQLIPSVVEELESKFGENLVESQRWVSVGKVLFEARARLVREIEALGRRGNLNLIVGVLATAFAIGLLAFFVLWNSFRFESMPSFLAHYVPRMTLVIFVEVFSFFFLRLYRASLLEIRTYQEDLTRLAIQEVAVTSVWTVSDREARAALSANLIAATKILPMKADKTVDPMATVEFFERLAKVFAKVKGDEKS